MRLILKLAPCNPFRRRRDGFTAIELSAVITIIMIMALILIPIVRSRVDEAKLVAAQDDMSGIEKAELMAYSYTGQYFRLQDLDRPMPNLSDATLTPAQQANELLKLPQAYWNAPVINGANLSANWKGPFYAIHKETTVDALLATQPWLFRGDGDPRAQQGPILVVAADRNDWQFAADNRGLTRQHYPIDPWGNPYLFFGPGKMGDLGGQNAITNETDFGTAVVYSLGPNGGPGTTFQSPTSVLFFRETGLLGTGDDLSREF